MGFSVRVQLSVCKSRVESRAQCVTNGAENSNSQLSRMYSLSLSCQQAESSDKESGFENRRTFSKKAREPQKYQLLEFVTRIKC